MGSIGYRDWRDRAACLEHDPELFFPIGSNDRAYEQMAVAKQVCVGCVVRGQCLVWALEIGQDSGVCGGMTEDERRSLRRRQVRPARKLADHG